MGYIPIILYLLLVEYCLQTYKFLEYRRRKPLILLLLFSLSTVTILYISWRHSMTSILILILQFLLFDVTFHKSLAVASWRWHSNISNQWQSLVVLSIHKLSRTNSCCLSSAALSSSTFPPSSSTLQSSTKRKLFACHSWIYFQDIRLNFGFMRPKSFRSNKRNSISWNQLSRLGFASQSSGFRWIFL